MQRLKRMVPATSWWKMIRRAIPLLRACIVRCKICRKSYKRNSCRSSIVVIKQGVVFVIWQRLSLPWQAAIGEAWAAYQTGSLPHGAVITDADGHIVAHGRNRINEKHIEGTELH